MQFGTEREGDEEEVTMTNDCNGDIGRIRKHIVCACVCVCDVYTHASTLQRACTDQLHSRRPFHVA